MLYDLPPCVYHTRLYGCPLVNADQTLHKVVLRRVDQVNHTTRVFRLEIPDKGSIRVPTLLSHSIPIIAKTDHSSSQANG